ncbi:MAG: NAD-dependent protein deacylase [Dehalobacterium sp.]|jgi:NAD-dependent deacetylase
MKKEKIKDNLKEQIRILKEMVDQSQNIVFFGGAGVSTASNIPDFRSANGLYNEKSGINIAPEEILSHTFFMNHTQEFFDFYRSKMVYVDAKPNDAHLALSKWEREGKLKAIITQNIDGLHQIAGSKNVLELHGSIHRNYCMSCCQAINLDYILSTQGVPLCPSCGGIVKPDVVLYEESLNSEVLGKSVESISQADVFIIGGTSLTVYPAAGLVTYYRGKKLALVNKTSTPFDDKAEITIYGDIAEVFRAIM